MRAMVIYESMFGDNQVVADAIAQGLQQCDVAAEPVEVGVASTQRADMADIDLLVVGAPNHGFSLPRTATRQDAVTKTHEPLVSRGRGVREWLESVDALSPTMRTAAFDTRMSHPRVIVAFDHASTSIEKGLAHLGARRLAPAEHFLVRDVTGPLEAGERDRAEAWGVELGRRLCGHDALI